MKGSGCRPHHPEGGEEQAEADGPALGLASDGDIDAELSKLLLDYVEVRFLKASNRLSKHLIVGIEIEPRADASHKILRRFKGIDFSSHLFRSRVGAPRYP